MDLARRKTKMRNLIFSPQSTPFVWYFPVALLFAKSSKKRILTGADSSQASH